MWHTIRTALRQKTRDIRRAFDNSEATNGRVIVPNSPPASDEEQID